MPKIKKNAVFAPTSHKTQKALESKARRLANKNGYRLVKSRERIEHANNFGGFMLVETQSNRVVVGERFDMILEDVFEFFREGVAA